MTERGARRDDVRPLQRAGARSKEDVDLGVCRAKAARCEWQAWRRPTFPVQPASVHVRRWR